MTSDMNSNLFLLPVLLSIALTMWLYIALAIAKRRAVAAGEVDESRRALHDDAWPDSVLQINNCIRNQFTVPVLFYVLSLMLWQLGETGPLAQALAWGFVASRYVHAWIHTGSNYVPHRRRVFMLGSLLVIAMTALAAVRLLAGS